MRHLTYLFSILVVCGIPWLIMVKTRERILKRYEIVILIVVFIGFIYSTTDFFALRWGAWFYTPSSTLNIHFLTEVETYIFGAAISLGVASATIIWAALVDRKNRKKKSTRR